MCRRLIPGEFSGKGKIKIIALLMLISVNVGAIELSIVSGDNQSAIVGQQFSERFVVQLTGDDGESLAGAPINFSNNQCVEIGGIPCPPSSAWGIFDTGTGSSTVLTDAQGIAISPIYIAGNTPSVGHSIIVWPVSGQPPYNFPFSEAWEAHKLIQFTQRGVPASPVPTLSLFNILIFILLMLFIAYKSKKLFS